MKIYTRKGDDGHTSLIGGSRVPKYDLRIEAYGTVDELNAHLGLIREDLTAESFRPILKTIQDTLFVVGSLLAHDPLDTSFKPPELKQASVDLLESSIDEMNETLPELKNFVLPGGNLANARAHIARCVCRRAERRVVELQSHAPVDPLIIRYLNRLSDWLFVLSRALTYLTGATEVVWKS